MNPNSRRPRSILRRLAAASTLALATQAHATWSIILIDLRTGEIAVGSATCLTGFDLRANTPVLLTGIGAATAQSFVDSTGQNRVYIRDRLALGVAPSAILTGLAGFDPGHQTRQYGIGDTRGRVATFSGTGANAWAGGQTGQYEYTHLGRTGNVAYAIQGNILTGPCVVDAAVQAAINTPGDLPARLMASMQAARLAGGDGRCSCPGNPTGCGCPPASFTKSSHIAYMLIARAGDRDASTGIYRAGSTPWAARVHDFNGDGRPDIAAANSASNNVSILLNTTPAGNPFAMYDLPVNYAVGGSPRAVAVADFTRDGYADVLTANFATSSLSLLPGTAFGTFGPRTETPASNGPQSLAAADFDGVNGPDVAVAHGTANNIWVFLNNGSGGLALNSAFAAGSDPRSLQAAELGGGPALDLAVVSRNTGQALLFINNGDGTYSPGPTIGTPGLPSALVARDLDRDGDTDLAVAVQSSPYRVVVYRNDGGTFTPTDYALPTFPNALGSGDLNADGDPDLVAPISGGRFSVLLGSAAGSFTVTGPYPTGGSPFDAQTADLNGDGDIDVALASTAGSVLIAENFGDGTFASGLGTGAGDYFMGFNVAFTGAPDPDPVVTLQAQFDQWRQGLSGRPDAVQTLVAFDPPTLSATPGAMTAMVITLRDWTGQTVDPPLTGLAVQHAPGSAGRTTIGAISKQGGGVYTVPLTAGNLAGYDRFRVTVDDGVRPVVLMPEPALTVQATCYADCNSDGTLNLADWGCFQTRFALGDPYADCNGDGQLNLADFGCWQTRWAQGCP